MNIKIILFNIILIVFICLLIYLYIYINYKYEGFTATPILGNEDVSIDTTYNNAFDNESNAFSSLSPILEEGLRDGLSVRSAINSKVVPYINVLLEILKQRNNTIRLDPFADGYYWVDLPQIGAKKIFCIMDRRYYGGGWMLAMRGVRGSRTFTYDSPLWTTRTANMNATSEAVDSVINSTSRNYNVSSIGDNIWTDYENRPEEIKKLDALYDTFNYYPATEWMAIFYYKDNRGVYVGGDLSEATFPAHTSRGWIWKEKNVSLAQTGTSIKDLFISRLERSTYNSAINLTNRYPGKTNAKQLDKFSGSINPNMRLWSSQSQYNFYGINYQMPPVKVRWGFTFNENGGNPPPNDTNDTYGGIGTRDYSARDYLLCCEDNAGVNRSIAFEWYVR